MIKLRSFVTHAIGFGFSTICKKREQKTGKSKGISVNVYNSNGAKVTNNWNWLNYLGFDKKGYSYELTQKEHDYFELVRNAKLDDFLGKLGKAENEIDNSLKTVLLGLGNLGR